MAVYYLTGIEYDSNYLLHHGIKGQRWGIRRYQNDDGSLTSEGQRRYTKALNLQKDMNRIDKELAFTTGDATKLLSKAYRQSSGKSINGIDTKQNNKLSGYMKKAQVLDKKIRDLSQQKGMLINIATNNGMAVYAKDIVRPTVRSKEIVGKALLMSGTLGIYNPTFTTAVQGTKYSVKKNKT